MSAPNSRLVEGKKFFWDGVDYLSQDDAAAARSTYERDGFETCTATGDGTFLVYTRRVVKQVTDAKLN
ncbi:MAG: hypothetical protein ACYC5Q_16825 [Thermoleophilia bacterium]